MHSFTTGLLTAATLITSTFAAAAVQRRGGVSSGGQLAVYYGQAGSQQPLGQYCNDPTIDIIPLSFVVALPGDPGSVDGYPTLNFGNQCSGAWQDAQGHDTGMFSNCDQMIPDIKTCQAMGKKVILSIGGGGNNVYFQDEQAGTDFATFMWGAFGPYQSGWNGPRPFGNDIVLDGFDFDIETDSSSIGGRDPSVGMVAAAQQFRALWNGAPYLLTAAPQCVTPTSSDPGPLGTLLMGASLDAVFIQFYNTPYCSAGSHFVKSMNGDISYDAWLSWLSQNSYNKNIKAFIGLPASISASNEADFYLSPTQLQSLIDEYGSSPMYGGIMLWEMTHSAQNMINGQTYAQVVKRTMEGQGSPTTTSTSASTTETSMSTSTTTTTITTTVTSTATSMTATTTMTGSPTTTITTSPSSSTTTTSTTPSMSSTSTTTSESPTSMNVQPTSTTTTSPRPWETWPSTSSTTSSTTQTPEATTTSTSSPRPWETWPSSSSTITTTTTTTTTTTQTPQATTSSPRPWETWPSSSTTTTTTQTPQATTSSSRPWETWPSSSTTTTQTPQATTTSSTSDQPQSSPTVTVTVITTSYVDICPTGYTTVPLVTTLTIPIFTPTGTETTVPIWTWPTKSDGCPSGFFTTTSVCSMGCGSTVVTVTVTLPTPAGVVTQTLVPVPVQTPAATPTDTSLPSSLSITVTKIVPTTSWTMWTGTPVLATASGSPSVPAVSAEAAWSTLITVPGTPVAAASISSSSSSWLPISTFQGAAASNTNPRALPAVAAALAVGLGWLLF